MKRTIWAPGFAMLVLAYILTSQYRAIQLAGAPRPVDSRTAELARALADTQAKLQAVEQENANLSATYFAKDPNLELLAGTVPAKGKGVIVTVWAPRPTTSVDESHLWLIMHELRAAGAEGMAINKQRITSVTEVREVNRRMLINQTFTREPYEIDVIGNPTKLDSALKAPGGVVSQLARKGVEVQVVRSDAVKLPGYGTPPDFQYLISE